MRDYLRKHGFDVIEVSDDKLWNYEETVIALPEPALGRRGGSRQALRTTNVIPLENKEKLVDATVYRQGFQQNHRTGRGRTMTTKRTPPRRPRQESCREKKFPLKAGLRKINRQKAVKSQAPAKKAAPKKAAVKKTAVKKAAPKKS